MHGRRKRAARVYTRHSNLLLERGREREKEIYVGNWTKERPELGCNVFAASATCRRQIAESAPRRFSRSQRLRRMRVARGQRICGSSRARLLALFMMPRAEMN